MVSVLQMFSLYVCPTKTNVIMDAGDESVAVYRFATVTFSVSKFSLNQSDIYGSDFLAFSVLCCRIYW
jgi:hypothetical protein